MTLAAAASCQRRPELCAPRRTPCPDCIWLASCRASFATHKQRWCGSVAWLFFTSPIALMHPHLQALVLALSGLLLPLPLKQHMAAQGGALLAALHRMPRLALLQAALPQRGEQCRAFVSGARYALQLFVPGGTLDVASHPRQVATSCWMQHTWLAVVAGFLLPTAAALIQHWRRGAAWPGSELALVAAMEAAAAARPGGRRRRTIAGSAEPASSDDGVSLSVAAPSSALELPASGSESLASTPSFRSGVSLSSVVSAGSGPSLSSSGGKSSSSGGKSGSSGGKSSSSSALSPRAAQQRWAMIQALRRHPEWLLQPTQTTRMQWLLLGVPLVAAVWAALEVAAKAH